MWNKWTARRIGAQKILPLIWQYGGPRQRFFLLFSLASAGLAIFLTALVVWMVLKSAWPDEVGWTYTLPLFGFMLLALAWRLRATHARIELRAQTSREASA